MPGVFISYRRDDCAGHAGRLYDRLIDRLGDGGVFMDIDAIEPGVDFGVRIEEAVGTCRLLIVLIGDEWLDIADEEGRRRIDDPADFVRLEVAAGLRREDLLVIPVLVEGAGMPPVQRLPDDLKALARRNALELSDARWRYDVDRLIDVIDRAPSGGRAPGLAARGLLRSLRRRAAARGRALTALALLAVALVAVMSLLKPDFQDRPKADAGDLATSAEKRDYALDFVSRGPPTDAEYALIEEPTDSSCGYSLGIIGFCSKSSEPRQIVDAYTKTKPENGLVAFRGLLDAANADTSKTVLGDGFRKAWVAAAADPAFQRAQRDLRDRNYLGPAISSAKADGLGALGQLTYYVAALLQGPGGLDSLRANLRNQAPRPGTGLDQRTYLTAFLDALREEAANYAVAPIKRLERILVDGKTDLEPFPP